MRVLVVGGAGYIGAHAVRALLGAGHEPVVFDNLSTGHAHAAQRLAVPLVIAELANREVLTRTLAEHHIDAVMHFAACCYVGESVTDPAKYYRNNVAGTLALLEAMRQQNVRRIIFSSTCATYGDPQSVDGRLDEEHPQQPINPYGRTKLMVEQMLRDFHAAYGLGYVALRYFNAAGASPDGLIGEDHDPETHLIPLCLLAALGRQERLSIFGTDYPTPDGTCIRDYIHVDDLAEAHVLALDYLAAGGEPQALNVGTGRGHSVREVIACAAKVSGSSIPVVEAGRRAGDPPILVAAAARIRTVLGWEPRHTELEPIVRTAWTWFQAGGKYGR